MGYALFGQLGKESTKLTFIIIIVIINFLSFRRNWNHRGWLGLVGLLVMDSFLRVWEVLVMG